MPAINFTQPIFRAGAAAATDWGAVEGKAESEFTAGAALKRGLKVEAGLSALVEVDASLAKFLAAQVTGRASAEARVTAQIQLPLNLFDEAGAAVRLQAVAEAAAGVQAGLGLRVGDFVELAQRVVGADGVPLRLILLFLEEIDLTAGVYAKVAATAQAQAYASIVGTLRSDPTRGLKPGFNIVAGAGLGLAAGAGVRVFARAGFRDFPRFYARAVDLVVDAVLDETRARLGTAAGPALTAALDAAAPPLKVAFRLAYEVGEFLATAKPPQNAQGAAALAARAAAVFFEEGQRYILRSFVAAGMRELRRLLGPRLAALDTANRARIAPRRGALVALLRGRPKDLFDLSSPATQDFWIALVEQTAALAVDLFAGTNPSPEVKRALSAGWCAAQLLLVATKRVTRAQASLTVASLPPQQAHAAFEGAPAAPPPRVVSDELVAALGFAVPSGGWRLEHAVSYLATAGGIALLEAAAPQTKPYLEAFRGIFGATTAAVAKTILGNLGAVAPAGGGAPDPQQTLRDLVGVLRTLVENVVDAQAMPAARTALAQSPEALLYLNDVLRPGLGFALGACSDLLLNWSSGQVAPTAATEALSGVVLKLLGRTLVVTGDVIQNYAQRETQGLLERLANDVRTNGLAAKFAALAALPTDVAAERAAEVLRLVGRTLAPYSESERREMRALFYAVLDPLPPAAGADFVSELARDSFLPNAEAAARLVQRTFDLLSERFVAFALGALEILGSAFLALIEDALQAAEQAVREWIEAAGDAIAESERRIAELGLEILAATDAAAVLADQALGELSAAFGALGASGRRSALRNRVADAFIEKVEDLLDDNPVYRSIPSELRSAARQSARSIVRGLANDLAAPVFDAIASVAEGASELLDDVRELDPATGLASGIGGIILDRVELAVRAAFGGDDPELHVGFDHAYSLPEIRLAPPGIVMRNHRVHVDLGRVHLPISTFVAIIRDVIARTSAFEAATLGAAAKLRAWLEKELEAIAKTDECDGLATEAESLRVEKAAVQGAPRDVILASPAHGSVYRDLVPVRAVLDDATPEFAEFERGPRRLFAYLNGEPLAAERFTIEARAPIGVGLGSIGAVRIDRGAAATPLPPGRIAAPAATGPGFAAIARTVSTPAPRMNALALTRGSTRRGESLVSAFHAGSRVRGVRPRVLLTGAGTRIEPGTALGGRNFKPGVRFQERDLTSALYATPRATVVLRAQLGLDECHAGMNALSITVVAANGARLTRTTTFVVEAPVPAVPPPLVGPRLPGVFFPPRRVAIAPARLKPKPAPAPLDAAARQKLSQAAKAAVVASKLRPARRIVALSPVLAARLEIVAVARTRTAEPARIAGDVPATPNPPNPAPILPRRPS